MITKDNYKDYETLHEIKNKRIYYKDRVKRIKQLTFIVLSALDLTLMYSIGKITNHLTFSTIDNIMFDSFLAFIAVVGISGACKISDDIRDKYNLKYFKADHPEIDTEIKDNKITYELAKYKENSNNKEDKNKEKIFDKKIAYENEEDFFAYLLINESKKENNKVKQKVYK